MGWWRASASTWSTSRRCACRRDFRRLFIGRSISEFGDEIVAVAVPFMVYDITKSTLAVGLLGLCELVPVFVFPIVGGAAADAMERRRLMIVSQVFLALMSLALAVNLTLDHPKLWPFYVFATLSAGMYTFNRPSLVDLAGPAPARDTAALVERARGGLRHRGAACWVRWWPASCWW